MFKLPIYYNINVYCLYLSDLLPNNLWRRHRRATFPPMGVITGWLDVIFRSGAYSEIRLGGVSCLRVRKWPTNSDIFHPWLQYKVVVYTQVNYTQENSTSNFLFESMTKENKRLMRFAPNLMILFNLILRLSLLHFYLRVFSFHFCPNSFPHKIIVICIVQM